MRRKISADLVLAVLAALLLGVLVTLRVSAQSAQTSVSSTYDTGAAGYAALYSFLQREGLTVSRFELPLANLPQKGTFVIAGDDALLRLAFSSQQHKALDTWVRGGRTLVVLGAAPPLGAMFGLPDTAVIDRSGARASCGLHHRSLVITGAFTQGFARACGPTKVTLLQSGPSAVGEEYARGRGTVIFIAAATPLDNLHLRQRDNAAFAYALFSSGGPVAFDEAAYGYESHQSMWAVLPPPVRYAIIVACVALLLAIIGANLPFAPPLAAQTAYVRDSSAYLASLARMLERGGTQRDAVARFCATIKKTLAPSASQAQARRLLEEARLLELDLTPGDDEVLAAARLFARVRKDYQW